MGSAAQPILTHLGRYTDGMLTLLRAALPEAEFARADSGDAPDGEVLVVLVDDASGFHGSLPASVRWVHVLGAGVDGFPLGALDGRTLTCSRGAAAPAIAEWVLASMLAFAKQMPESVIASPDGYRGRPHLRALRGATLGIIGLGSIGTEVARRALAFEMRVLATRRTAAAPGIAGVELVDSLHKVFEASDHVVVTAPATPETHHLLDAAAFAAIKPGAHLVNVARGSLIDQEALLEALEDGRIARASLDVVDPEPLPEGHPLYSHPRVRITPHISWSSPDTLDRTIGLFAENLYRYRAGEALRGVVDPVSGY